MPSKNIMPKIEDIQSLIMEGNEEFLRQMLTKMLNVVMEQSPYES